MMYEYELRQIRIWMDNLSGLNADMLEVYKQGDKRQYLKYVKLLVASVYISRAMGALAKAAEMFAEVDDV